MPRRYRVCIILPKWVMTKLDYISPLFLEGEKDGDGVSNKSCRFRSELEDQKLGLVASHICQLDFISWIMVIRLQGLNPFGKLKLNLKDAKCDILVFCLSSWDVMLFQVLRNMSIILTVQEFICLLQAAILFQMIRLKFWVLYF